jgi:hypothetical protein
MITGMPEFSDGPAKRKTVFARHHDIKNDQIDSRGTHCPTCRSSAIRS